MSLEFLNGTFCQAFISEEVMGGHAIEHDSEKPACNLRILYG